MSSTDKYAFIFDMDGVVVDSNPYHKIALKKFCEKHGIHLSEHELLNKIYGRTNKDWIVNVFGNISADQISAFADEKESLFRDIYQHDVVPLPGLLEFLNKMDEYGIARAIGTSAPVANVDFTLSKTKTAGFFPVILKDTDITNGKPDPEIYLKAAASLGFAPDKCIVFEDSLSGVAAAKSAGAKVVGISTTHTIAELSHTDLVIADFSALDPLALISGIFKKKNA